MRFPGVVVEKSFARLTRARVIWIAFIVAAAALAIGVRQATDPTDLHTVAYVLAAAALAIAFSRGGIRAYPFWITLLLALPVLTPFIVQNVLGVPHISARHILELQTPEVLAMPLLFGGVAALLCSLLTTSVGPGSAVRRTLSPARCARWLSALSLPIVALAVLAEPGPPIGLAAKYSDILAGRLSGMNFAGGAWAILVVFGLVLERRCPKVPARHPATWAKRLFFVCLVFTGLWLLAHARRSEISGLIVIALFLYGGSHKASRIWSIFIPLIVSAALVGYVRNPATFANFRNYDYLQLPGAPGNILVGWAGAYEAHRTGALQLPALGTYAAQLINLPPRFLGLERAPTLEDLVVPIYPALKGAAQYFLSEPYVNFGPIGMVVAVLVLVLLTNASCSAVVKYLAGRSNVVSVLQAGNFLVMIFRTMWYGLDAVVTGSVMALAISLAFVLYRDLVRRWRNGALAVSAPGTAHLAVGGSTPGPTTTASTPMSTPKEEPASGRTTVLNFLHRSHPGGAHWRAVWVADGLRRHGVDTTIVFPADADDRYEGSLRESGVPFVRTRLSHISRSPRDNLSFLLRLPLEVAAVRRVLRQHEADIVHVNGVTNLQPVMAALLHRCPVIWHFNDMQTPRWFVRLVTPMMRRRQVTIATATEAILDHYGLRGLPRWQYLPAPVPPREAHTTPPPTLASLGLPGNAKVLGFVGNLVPVKGAEDFLHAALRILKDRPDVHAIVVGPDVPTQPDYGPGLRALAKSSEVGERVHFVGFQRNVAEWLALMDVLLFPSYSEACPIVVLETMAAGVPIVPTRVGDVPRMFEGMEIVIVDIGDDVALERNARELLDMTAADVEALALRLRERAQSAYSLERVTAIHLELYAAARRLA